jgi:tetratricopeptide (TPR) repeat protein
LDGARKNLEEAQKRFRRVGDQNGLGSSLTNLGEVYRAKGDLTPAEDLYREALEIFRKTSHKENEYSTLNNLGGLLYEQGDFRGARKIFENLLQLRQASGDKSGIGFAKTNLADALRVQGDLDRAANLHEEALRIFRDTGDRATSAAVETSYAKVLLLKGDLAAARVALSDALKITQQIGAKGDAAYARVLLVKVAFFEGHPEQVEEGGLGSAIEELRAEQRGADEMEALTIQVRALLASGKIESAQQSLIRAQGLTNASWLSRFDLAIASAQIDAAQGKIAMSRQKIKAAQAQAEKAGCRACVSESRLLISKIDAQGSAAGPRDLL